MAKKKKAAPQKKRVPKAVRELRARLQGPELGDFTGAVAQRICSKMRAETGDDFVTNVGRARGLVIGIPVPSLAFEYLLRSNILPLGKMMMLVGIEKVGKSGFLFEIIRWFRKLRGFGVLLEHESKFNPDWANSILGWDDPDAMTHVPCDSIEAWQKAMTGLVDWVKKEMVGDKKHIRPGKTWPFVMGVDSIMGKSTEGTQKKIAETGYSQKHFADEARSITDYMRFIPQKIARWPFFMIGVNHMKPSTDPVTKARIRQTAGGRGVNFQESIELEVNWAKGGRKSSRLRLADREGMRLRVTCENNSYGPAHNEIDVTVWTWQEELEGGADVSGKDTWRPVTVWDWHGSTTQLLLKECAAGGSGTAKSIKEIVNIQQVSGKSLYTARVLGVSKSDPQPADVIGKMIYEDPEMMQALRKIFKIRTWPVFQPGVDFDEQLAAQKQQLVKQKVRVKKRVPKKQTPKEQPAEEAAPEKKRRVKKKKGSQPPSKLASVPPSIAKKRKARPRGRSAD